MYIKYLEYHYTLILLLFFLDFLLSFEHSMSSPKNDSLSLKWILESKTALPYFIDYLTTINCDSFISFYINIDGEFLVHIVLCY